MKHFLIDIEYIVPLARIDEIVAQHRAFLQTGYDKGWLLMSGPKNPKTGGVVIARAPSLEELQELFNHDPYQLNQAAVYQFREFDPVKRQAFMEEWITAA